MIVSFIRQNEVEDIFRIRDGERISYIKYPRTMHMTEAMVAEDEGIPAKAKKDVKVKEVVDLIKKGDVVVHGQDDLRWKDGRKV